MNRATPLLTLMTLLSVALGACGQATTPAAPAAATVGVPAVTGQPVAGQPVTPAPTPVRVTMSGLTSGITVTAAVFGASQTSVSASLHLAAQSGSAGLSTLGLSVRVESAPSGVDVQVLPLRSDDSGLTLPLRVTGTDEAAQGEAVLSVQLNGQTERVRVPVLRAVSVALPEIGGRAFRVASSASCGPDMVLSAAVNAPSEQRSQLLRFRAASGSFQLLALGLGTSEGVTSQLCAPDETLWLTLRSDDAQGSVLARLNPGGTLERFPVGATADTLNNLSRTPDGRLWFVQYRRDRLGEFDPSSGRVTTHPVSENAENLRLGQDGALYYSQFYSAPAVVRYDPASGSSTPMSVGTSSRNLPRASVQTGGVVWYVDAWTQTLNRLDPRSGRITPARLPGGAAPGELVADEEGTLWVADAVKHLLYRLSAGSLEAVTVPLASADGPRALSIGAGGRLWYESGGMWVGQQ